MDASSQARFMGSLFVPLRAAADQIRWRACARQRRGFELAATKEGMAPGAHTDDAQAIHARAPGCFLRLVPPTPCRCARFCCCMYRIVQYRKEGMKHLICCTCIITQIDWASCLIERINLLSLTRAYGSSCSARKELPLLWEPLTASSLPLLLPPLPTVAWYLQGHPPPTDGEFLVC